MKYKVGDKVKIKTWAKMEKEFGNGTDQSWQLSLPGGHRFTKTKENCLVNYNTNRVIEIGFVIDLKNHSSLIDNGYSCDCYMIKRDRGWYWTDDMIEGLYPLVTAIPEIESSRLDFIDLDK